MIVDQQKYSMWIEEKNKGRSSLKLSKSVKGEIVRPKSAKRLGDQSMTKIDKKGFNVTDNINLQVKRPQTANLSIGRQRNGMLNTCDHA